MHQGFGVDREIKSVTHHRQLFNHAGKANNLFTYVCTIQVHKRIHISKDSFIVPRKYFKKIQIKIV